MIVDSPTASATPRRHRLNVVALLWLGAVAHIVFVVRFSGRFHASPPRSTWFNIGALTLVFVAARAARSRLRDLRATFGFARCVVAMYAVWGVTLLAHGLVFRSGTQPGGLLLRLVVFTGPGGTQPDTVLGLGVGLVPFAAAAALGFISHRRWPALQCSRPDATIARLLAFAATLAAVPAVGLITRQYREQFAATSHGLRIGGSVVPAVMWSSLLAVAIGAPASVIAVTAFGRPNSGLRVWVSHRWTLFAITGAAFTWRVVALVSIAPARTDGGDPLYYHTQANGLARGTGFIEPLNWIAYGRSIPTALHGPGYPVYLSFFSRMGADTFFDHRMASSLIGAASVFVIGLIAHRLAGPTAMMIAACLAAVYPNMWTIDGVLFPEGLFIFCCTVATFAAYRWAERPHWRDGALMGLAIGCAALTRGEGLFLLGLLVVPLVGLRHNLAWRTRVATLAVVGAAALAVLAPWMVRNLTTFERFVPLSTNGNELHVYSNCDTTYSGKFIGFWSFACQTRLRDPNGDGVVDFEPDGDESETAAYWQEVGFTYAKDHASRLPVVLAARLGRQWEVFRPLQNAEFAPIEGRRTDFAQLALAMYYPMAALSLLGIRRLRRRGASLVPLLAHVAGVSLTALYAYGTIRFRAPAEMVLCVLAGVGAAPFVTRGVRALRRERAADQGAEPDPSAWVTPGTAPRHRGRTMIGLGGLAFLVALPLRGLFRTPGSTMEEGFMLTFPERVLRGDIPNDDFLHLYGPGSLHALAGVYKIFGTHVDVERAFGLGQHLLILSAIYTLTRAWGRSAAFIATAAAITLVLTPIGLSALAWNGAIGLALWSVAFGLRAERLEPGSRHRRLMLAASGAFGGLALAFRPDIVVALGVAHFILLRRRRQELRLLLGSAAVGLLPMWVHLAIAGPFDVIRGVVLEPVFKLRGGRTLPAPPSWGHLDGALQVIADKIPPWWGAPSPSASQQLFLWFMLTPFIAAAPLVVAWRLRRRNTVDPAARLLTVTGAFGVGILQQAFQRPDSAHFAWVGMVTVPLLVPSVIEWRRLRQPRSNGANRLVWAFAVVSALLLVVMPFFTLRIYTLHVRQSLGQLPPGLRVDRNDRSFYLGDVPPWKAAQALVNELDRLSTPGETLLVGPADLRQTAYSDAFFYHLFPELPPATRYIEMDPGMANAEDSELADEVASADWLILTRFWSGWIEPNDSIVFGPDDPNAAVEANFCLVGSYEHDLARLYQRCEGGGAPGPYEGPYEPDFDPAVEVRVPVPRRPDGTCTPTCLD